MIIYIVIVLLLTLLYVFIFLLYLSGWLMAPEFQLKEKLAETKCSIIVAARNEEHHIGNLLRDLISQTYPASLFEIIVIDDFSQDETAAVIRSFNSSTIQLLQLSDVVKRSDADISFKKKALEYGIQKSNGELIITTDADCRMGKEWLQTLVSFYQSKKCHMIVAPVLFFNERNFFGRLQSLDFLGLIGITGGTLQWNFPTMCNGANLAFQKKDFEAVGGYTGIDHVTSGDDLLLMHKIAKRWNKGVLFLKNRDAAVYTYPQNTLRDFLSQRIRWTTKSKHYADKRIIINLVIVYFFNLSLVINFLFCFIFLFSFSTEPSAQLHSSFVPQSFTVIELFAFQLILKMIVEFSFLSQVTWFFKRQKLLWLFLPAQLLHVVYIVVVGALGNFIKPTWKGRKIS